jgi:hypothetical protein
LLQVFLYKLAQDRVAGDFPGALPAPSALGTPLSRPRTVTTGGLMSVPADLPAYRRRTPSELPGNGTDLRPLCNRSAIVIRSDSERNRAEMTVGLRSEMGAYFLLSPDLRTTVWPCRHRVPELRLIPTIRQASELPFPVSSADHNEHVQRSSEALLGTSSAFSSLPIATPKSLRCCNDRWTPSRHNGSLFDSHRQFRRCEESL